MQLVRDVSFERPHKLTTARGRDPVVLAGPHVWFLRACAGEPDPSPRTKGSERSRLTPRMLSTICIPMSGFRRHPELAPPGGAPWYS